MNTCDTPTPLKDLSKPLTDAQMLELQKRIAAWMGYYNISSSGRFGDKAGHTEQCRQLRIPNYTKDLNAMHEAESQLGEEQLHEMNEYLYEMLPVGTRMWRAEAWQRGVCLLAAIHRPLSE